MAQWLREHSAIGENLNLIPSINVGQLTTVDNSSSREFNTLSWLSQPCTHGYKHT